MSFSRCSPRPETGRRALAARGMLAPPLLALVAAIALVGAGCQPPPPTYKVVAAKEGETHLVLEGETLQSIAEKYYGDETLGSALGEYNNLDPLEPIETGRTLLVPYDASILVKMTRTNEGYVAYNRGTMLARTGQYPEALPYLEKAVAADPGNADAWHNLAVTYQKVGRNEDALSVLDRLTRTHRSEKAYHYSRGSVLRALARKSDALKSFKKAIEIDHEYREAQYALAVTLEDLGKNRQARQAWQRYLEIDEDSVWSEEARLRLKNLGGN